jgi:hypothetical protein
MIKLILVGVWACAVTLASSYAAVTFLSGPGPGHDSQGADQGHGGHKADSGVEHLRPRMISVPIIADGAVQGYAVAQFVLTVDTKELKRLSVPPEPLFLDEAFKAIYAGETIDFRRFRKQDLPGLAKRIQAGANKRYGAHLIQDVLIQELNYVPKDEARGRVQ